MKAAYFILALLFGVIACQKDNFLQLSTSETLKNFLPDYSSDRFFASNNGDTIRMKRISGSTNFERVNAVNNARGSLPDYDYVEAEQQKLVIGSDTPYTRFNFELSTQYNPSIASRKEDFLSLTFEEESGVTNTGINLTFRDSVICLNQRCRLQDTLKLQNNTFFEVYFTPRDSVNINALYLNESSGLVGFKTSDNRIFELIP